MHAPAGLRLRYALDAVDAGFKLESRIRPIAADDKVSFLNTAQLRIVVVEQLHAVPPLFRVHRIHAVEVGGKKRALLPAHAAADLDDDVFVVVRVARQEQHAQLVKKALFFRLGSVQFLLRHVLELGVGYKLQRLHDVVLALLVRAVGLHHGGKLLLLAREPGRRLDDDGDELVAARLVADIGDALAAQAEGRAGLRALGNLIAHLAVKRGYLNGCAERSLCKGDGHLAHDVRAVARKNRVLAHGHGHEQIAVRAAV